MLKKIRKVEGVEEAYISYGMYDIMAKVRADTMEGLKQVITNHLRQISNIRSTLSLILVEE